MGAHTDGTIKEDREDSNEVQDFKFPLALYNRGNI